MSKQAAHKKHASRPPKGVAPVGDGQRLVITGQARRAVEYAREEARKLEHPAVEPVHLLLGLLRSGDGPARNALREAGLDLDATRREIQAVPPAGANDGAESTPGARLPVSPRARGAFEQALREAVSRGDGHLGMEHIMLALLRDSESGAVETLGRLGVPPRQLGRTLERAIVSAGEHPPDTAP